jgi:hypothetical protein
MAKRIRLTADILEAIVSMSGLVMDDGEEMCVVFPEERRAAGYRAAISAGKWATQELVGRRLKAQQKETRNA